MVTGMGEVFVGLDVVEERVTVGEVVSTKTAVVIGAVYVRAASLPAASLITPPFEVIKAAHTIPSASPSPNETVYRNTSS
ncbi:hypothetical protein SDC9_207797 [bioreactor metagenome]|uniref:Uncharacterized protein n=1 Tax=bioreactor metagenome TaxID=1076179 RepID=A0A645JIB7_9ZZZZ